VTHLGLSGASGVGGNMKERVDLHLLYNEKSRAAMDTSAVRAMVRMFRRKSSASDMISNPREVDNENLSRTTVENLSVEQIKCRWRRKQIEIQEKQLTHLDSSWRLKQMFGLTGKESNLQKNHQGFSFFEGNPSGMRRDSMQGEELDANPLAQIPKTFSVCKSASSIWQRSRGSKN
jgi:hypothetical protein